MIRTSFSLYNDGIHKHIDSSTKDIKQSLNNTVNAVNANGKSIRFQAQDYERSRREHHDESMRQQTRIAAEHTKEIVDLKNEVKDEINRLVTAITPKKQPPLRRNSNFPKGVSIIADTDSVDQTAITESTMASSNSDIQVNLLTDQLKQVKMEKKLLQQQLR